MTSLLDAQYYRENSSIQAGLAAEFLQAHHVTQQESILDVGCGDGRLTAGFAEVASQGKVCGVDPSEEMIALAQASFSQQQFSNLSFQVAQAESDHGVEQFSLVTALSCMHWVRDLSLAFQQFYRCLQAGGRVLILTYPRESEFYQPFVEVLNREKWRQYLPMSMCVGWKFSKEYSELAESLGFQVQQADVIQSVANHENQQAFKAYCKGWLPCLLAIDSMLLEDYLEEVTQQVWQDYSLANGGCEIPYTKLHFCCQK
jgi:ubiquinone/menaquinone biosynthesis C-methylase UbiE